MASARPGEVSAEIRAIVAQVVREVVVEVARTSATGAEPAVSTQRAPDAPAVVAPGRSPWPDRPQPTGPARAAARSRLETVRITGSGDLQSFVLHLLELFESPKTREDVRTGRLGFALAGGVAAPAAPGAVELIERGAVTERKVAAAASAGTRLVLGPRAVLTPLAREKARALGVVVEKEH